MWERVREWWENGGASSDPKDAGQVGEKAAALFLRGLHYSVLTRNWRNPKDRREEIDLVCRQGEVLVFVEVKTRQPGALISGFHAIDSRKKKALRRAIQAYLHALGPDHQPHTFRCDVVEVTYQAGGIPACQLFEHVSLSTRPPPR